MTKRQLINGLDSVECGMTTGIACLSNMSKYSIFHNNNDHSKFLNISHNLQLIEDGTCIMHDCDLVCYYAFNITYKKYSTRDISFNVKIRGSNDRLLSYDCALHLLLGVLLEVIKIIIRLIFCSY